MAWRRFAVACIAATLVLIGLMVGVILQPRQTEMQRLNEIEHELRQTADAMRVASRP